MRTGLLGSVLGSFLMFGLAPAAAGQNPAGGPSAPADRPGGAMSASAAARLLYVVPRRVGPFRLLVTPPYERPAPRLDLRYRAGEARDAAGARDEEVLISPLGLVAPGCNSGCERSTLEAERGAYRRGLQALVQGGTYRLARVEENAPFALPGAPGIVAHRLRVRLVGARGWQGVTESYLIAGAGCVARLRSTAAAGKADTAGVAAFARQFAAELGQRARVHDAR